MSEHVLGKTVYSREDIQELERDVGLTAHNMWVDERSQDVHGGYSRVDITVEITVRERDDID